MQTPRFCGHACIAGVFDFLRNASRPLRTSWLIVGMALRRREQRQNSHFITGTPSLVNDFDHFASRRTHPSCAPTVSSHDNDPSDPIAGFARAIPPEGSFGGAVQAPPKSYPAAATDPSPSPTSAGGGSSVRTLSSDFTASPPGV